MGRISAELSSVVLPSDPQAVTIDKIKALPLGASVVFLDLGVTLAFSSSGAIKDF